jgi:hypothetical protein
MQTKRKTRGTGGAGCGYYIAITHSGVTMSPFVGPVVADEIVRGRQRAELANFWACAFLQLTWRRNIGLSTTAAAIIDHFAQAGRLLIAPDASSG